MTPLTGTGTRITFIPFIISKGFLVLCFLTSEFTKNPYDFDSILNEKEMTYMKKEDCGIMIQPYLMRECEGSAGWMY